ncbi:uric acid-xanthine permease [Cladophialophora yegresii CBS 114405]|uniref:Uric acid-xanthine permease n=1 Tax=Cladophialophora yegresii CBS 114405 TaxID=1182544 RepID=W9W984_9EURO|nr:uric acid-xanthine permease [Cladophialophora yegresii CBS 114405]EXJ64677.1 uric acid-xanthine permease [Cladophialophora yegresii CBS 114405]
MGEAQSLPHMGPKKTFADRANGLRKALFTRKGLVGDYDYAFLFRPNLPFLTKTRRASPFFGLDDSMPVVLALLLGFQHALAMLAGIITPPLILAGAGGVNLPVDWQQYLVSTSLIVCGILSCIQITRFHIWRTPYYVGTGLISVVGTSFAIIPVATGAFTQMYANGKCQLDADGNRLPCPDAYGALIGTCALCALVEIALSFLPPNALRKIFPPIVTGPTVILIGVSLIESGFQNWAGGSGLCAARPESGPFQVCPQEGAPHALPWGSAEYIGLGFLVFVTILLCERFGSPIMKSTSVILGLLTGCIVAAACGYFDNSGINSAPVGSFIWVKTFKLSLYGPLVLPIMVVFIICACEAIGDITATCDVSRLEVEGRQFESRIQGGVLADGLNGCLAALMTITPMSTFAQNNGVIALTRCANRKAGYFCCFFLIVAGIFAKFSAALVAIPSSVLGGMTTFLFCAVAVSGMAIVNRVPFNRRTRFILTASLALGYGATLVPTWFNYVFTYQGDNHALRGFYDALVLVCETGFAITAFVSMILNLTLPDEIEDIPAAEPQQDMLVKPGSDAGSSAAEGVETKGQMSVAPGKELV